MSVRLAVFAGVYSNHAALRAVLADLRRSGADATWCLGDIGGFAPHPDRALDLLRASGVPTLRGNYDDAIGHGRGDCACGYTDPRDNHFAQLAYDYTLGRTAAHHRRWLRTLPESARLEVAGRRILLCHGSPRRVNEFLWASSSSDAFLGWLCAAHDADVVVCAHTGLHWQRALPGGRHVVNAGAIGRPANDGSPAVHYAWITLGRAVAVEFRDVAYDAETVAGEVEAEGLPAAFAATLRTGWWTTCLENLPAPERRRGRY